MNKREKGKVPHTEWAAIVSRAAGGESLASIARSYNCTGPAIRYILNRKGTSSPGGDQPPLPEPNATSRERPMRRAGPAVSRHQGFDPELREKIRANISSFLVTFDAALEDMSRRNVEDFRDAIDSLMRSAARARIELEQILAKSQAGTPKQAAGSRSA